MIPSFAQSLTQWKGHKIRVLDRLFLFMLAYILPSPLIASGMLVCSLSVHEKGHLWNNMLDETPWTSLCSQRLKSTMTDNETWGKHGERIPGTTWFKLGLQGPLGHWSYFTASLRNGTIELAWNVTWLLRLKTDVNFLWTSVFLSSKQSQRR